MLSLGSRLSLLFVFISGLFLSFAWAGCLVYNMLLHGLYVTLADEYWHDFRQ